MSVFPCGRAVQGVSADPTVEWGNSRQYSSNQYPPIFSSIFFQGGVYICVDSSHLHRYNTPPEHSRRFVWSSSSSLRSLHSFLVVPRFCSILVSSFFLSQLVTTLGGESELIGFRHNCFTNLLGSTLSSWFVDLPVLLTSWVCIMTSRSDCGLVHFTFYSVFQADIYVCLPSQRHPSRWYVLHLETWDSSHRLTN